MAIELAGAIRACNAGDRTALHRALAKAVSVLDASKKP